MENESRHPMLALLVRMRWGLLVFVLLGMGSLIWTASYQSPTMKAIESVGGELYEPSGGSLHEKINSRFRQLISNPIPKILCLGPRDLSRDFCHQVYNDRLTDEAILQIDLSETGALILVDLSGPHVTDRGFSHIAGNPQINNVACRRGHVTDAGLASIVGNPNLRYLDISGNDITDAGIGSLVQSQFLYSIRLQDTLVTNQGLPQLASNHPKLALLDIGSTDVTDEGLAELSRLPRLTCIHLDVLQLTDIGKTHLQQTTMPLSAVGVSSCSPRKQSRLRRAGRESFGKIDDDVIARISQIKTLQFLFIRGTSEGEQASLTSAAVKSLVSMPSLSMLYLNGIQVDPAVLKQIQTELPVLKVTITSRD